MKEKPGKQKKNPKKIKGKQKSGKQSDEHMQGDQMTMV